MFTGLAVTPRRTSSYAALKFFPSIALSPTNQVFSINKLSVWWGQNDVFNKMYLDRIILLPCGEANCYVNGKQVTEATELRTGSRVIFGIHHVFRFTNPLQGDIAFRQSRFAEQRCYSFTARGETDFRSPIADLSSAGRTRPGHVIIKRKINPGPRSFFRTQISIFLWIKFVCCR